MDCAAKSRLAAIVAAHESEIEREQDSIDQEQMAEVFFAQQFSAWKKNVVVSAFTEVQSELKNHGHECKIVDADELEPGDASGNSVRCEFYPMGRGLNAGGSLAGPASLTVACEPESRSIKLVECTFDPLDNGWEGELGAFNMEEITRDMMAEVFVALVEKILLDKSFFAKSTQDLRPSWIGPGTRPRTRSPARAQIGRSRYAA